MNGNSTLVSNQCADIAGKFLTYTLGNESYGIPVLKVREIIKLVPITAVPQMPDYVKGVINLRGKIIPVVDLRIKFNLAQAETTERTCIIVVQVDTAKANKLQMGLIVDAVEEVIQIASDDIEEAPDFGTAVDTVYVRGMAKIKEKVKILLDIDKVLIQETICPQDWTAKTAEATLIKPSTRDLI